VSPGSDAAQPTRVPSERLGRGTAPPSPGGAPTMGRVDAWPGLRTYDQLTLGEFVRPQTSSSAPTRISHQIARSLDRTLATLDAGRDGRTTELTERQVVNTLTDVGRLGQHGN